MWRHKLIFNISDDLRSGFSQAFLQYWSTCEYLGLACVPVGHLVERKCANV